jgi:hypothetical protein
MFAGYLRQSTSADIVLGPVWDTATGALKSDLAYNAAGINCDVYKNGTKADVTLANGAGDGYFRAGSGEAQYILTLSTGNTDTIGRARITLSATGFYAAPIQYVVLSQAVYDSLFGATALSTYAGGDVQLAAVQDHITPYSGTPPTADQIADEVQTRTIAAVTSIPAVTGATLDAAYDHAKDNTLGAITALADTDDLEAAVDATLLAKMRRNKQVESEDGTTVTLYDDDDVTPLGYWPRDVAHKTRGKFIPAGP